MRESGGGERRERKDAQRNLERVLRAAHELFAERGTEVTMEEVAQRAGVGVGTIYRRFANKDELFAHVSQTACAHTRLHIAQAVHAERDPVLKLRALVLVQYQRSEAQAALLEPRPPAREAMPDGAFAEHRQLYSVLHDLLAQVIAEGQAQGSIRAGDPAVLAALCLELLNPQAFRQLQRITGGSAEDVAAHAIGFVLGGLGVHCEHTAAE
ncbi:MAG TPA: TetR/AcrR family transcriptional regulator [Roseiflexaceae bacterium]|nr:TetR/AcrR family transcriptional regulator [Roseiflexaceae bacterium]